VAGADDDDVVDHCESAIMARTRASCKAGRARLVRLGVVNNYKESNVKPTVGFTLPWAGLSPAPQ
jgi:hypothetical protein